MMVAWTLARFPLISALSYEKFGVLCEEVGSLVDQLCCMKLGQFPAKFVLFACVCAEL